MQYFAPFLLAAAAASSVSAQAQEDDYLTGLGNVLRDAGLTQVAELAATIPSLQAVLEGGGNKTILAPVDDAVNGLPEAQRADISLTYHIVNSTVERDDLDDDEHTVRSTLLSDIDLVKLGGRPQVVVLSQLQNDTDYVSLPRANVTFADDDDDANSTLRYRNLIIHKINGVLLPPGNLSEVANQAGLSNAAELLQASDLLEPLEQSTRGFTLFVPNNAAIEAAQDNITAVAAEDRVNVLLNHALNGTVLYSSSLPSDDNDGDESARLSSAVSATGNNLTFTYRDDNVYVRSGEIEARVLRSDVLYAGGVVHVIDAVLLNTTVNQDAADEAADEAESPAPGGDAGAGGGGNTDAPDGASGKGIAMSSVALVAVASAFYVLF